MVVTNVNKYIMDEETTNVEEGAEGEVEETDNDETDAE